MAYDDIDVSVYTGVVLGVSLSVYTCLASERTRGGGGCIFSAVVPVQWSLVSDSRGLLSVFFPAPNFFYVIDIYFQLHNIII